MNKLAELILLSDPALISVLWCC